MTLATLALLALAAPASAAAAGPFSIAENGRSFFRLDDAIKALGGSGGTIVVAPGTYHECAVFSGGALSIRAQTPGSAIFDGVACEGKAALVLRGLSAEIDGLVFQNIRVPDRNGSGIRLEKGDLHVTRTTFRNSEQGILSAGDPNGTVAIDHSTFSGLGGCPDGTCSHSIYIGDYGSVTISKVRFERGTGGHYLKSRAGRVSVLDSSFDDSNGKATNYMIDLPEGAVGTIARNVFVQGKDKENHSAFVAVAAEQRNHPSAGLVVADNIASFAPGVSWGSSVFVADWSHEPLKVGANKLASGIKLFETR
ncbi:right-handed parallel beta-helix repeat-containing protein [Sphingomonas sp.]|uniref:right-handed parallel beta-helix repeat-containing protein n=1 Tax=Sphingomonas sp. TaxID=28214 RepID=UPI0025CFD825|nr:right-handed parallel beta-helix repeat-containing protein [Sphingomonas sp.]